MKLFLFELRKTILIQKGWIIILACLIANPAVLFFFPEQKDSRIQLSQRQYDIYLEQLIGPATVEKEIFIYEERDRINSIIEQYGIMLSLYESGEISYDEFWSFIDEYEDAKLKSSAIGIFYEKVLQFHELKDFPDLLPPEYFYEYGWKSVFTYYTFPSVFLLLIAALIGVQSFGSEYVSGMLNILRVTKKGRTSLFASKILVILFILVLSAVSSTLGEFYILNAKGWLNNPDIPIYSVANFTGVPLEISLFAGLIQIWLIRAVGLFLFGIVISCLSILLKNPVFAFFTGTGIILIPYIIGLRTPFWFAGFISGQEVLLRYNYGQGFKYWGLPLMIVCIYTLAVFYAAYFNFISPSRSKKIIKP